MPKKEKDLEKLGEEALKKLEGEAEEQEIEEVEIESTSIEDPEPTPEEAEAIVAQKKARIAQVMTKGITNDKLQQVYDKCVPDGYSGKFVRNTEEDIIRYRNLGFGFTYAEEAEGLHGSADKHVRVGDVVLMTITLEDRDILKSWKAEKMQRNLGKGKDEYKRRSEEHVSSGGSQPFDMGSSTNVAVGVKET